MKYKKKNGGKKINKHWKKQKLKKYEAMNRNNMQQQQQQ